MINKKKAEDFIIKNARPLELALYNYHFKQGKKEEVIKELAKFQNEDGGFGHALEADNWNPNSSPITTNEAFNIIYRVGAINEGKELIKGIIKYLKSHDSFDEEKKRWLFAIDSNKYYPHAIWWEKKEDGISFFNPTIQLASILLCLGAEELSKEERVYYVEIIKEAFDYLKDGEPSGDLLKCYIISFKMLKEFNVQDVINFDEVQALLCEKIKDNICQDLEKYGVEYVSLPSDFFACGNNIFVTEEVQKLIEGELNILDKLQQADGGFDISWQWYNDYQEFVQARNWWRARITIDKLLFEQNYRKDICEK